MPSASLKLSPAPTPSGVRFSSYLQAMSSEIQKARSGERSRLKLLASAVRLLETVHARELKVEDIARDAELAKGVFYIHFTSKDDFLLDLASRYVDVEMSSYPAVDRALSRFGNLKVWVIWYSRMFALNVGVIRCLVQESETSAEMRAVWHRRNGHMVDRSMQDYMGRGGRRLEKYDLVRQMIRTAGGMLDQSLFERHHIQVGPGRADPADEATWQELQTLLMYRAVYGENPRVEELGPTRPLLNWLQV